MVDGAITGTTGCSLSPSVEPETSEEMSTPSREQLSPDGGKGWWNADLEGGMEKVAVEGAVTGTASRSKNLDGKADHWSAGVARTKEESERVRLTAAERQPANKVEGDFLMCEVEEQQAARVEVQGPKKKSSDTCGIRRNARLCS